MKDRTVNKSSAPDPDLNSLLAMIAQDDKQAFAAFYRAMERPLYKFIRLKLNDPVQSADILHDVFIEVWKGAARFEGRSSVKTWVFGIAYRKSMDVFRKASKMVVVAEMPELTDDSPTAEQCLYAAQRSEHVRHCLDILKPEHRSVIDLAFFEDFSYRQISEIIEAPEGTVKTRVFHAKKLLMRCLEKRIKPGEI